MADKKRKGLKPEDAFYCAECEVPVPKKLAQEPDDDILGSGENTPLCPKCKGPLVEYKDAT